MSNQISRICVIAKKALQQAQTFFLKRASLLRARASTVRNELWFQYELVGKSRKHALYSR